MRASPSASGANAGMVLATLLRRDVFRMSAAMAMLAGCGGSQPPIGASGAIPQNRAVTTRAERGGSWVPP
jgi:hypothetical protein